MRDDSYLESEVETESQAPEWRSKAVTAVGALTSIAILLLVVVWSYRLGVQDATEIPVIRAELEATKERPADPGGLEVAHQNRAVYSIVSSGGDEAPTSGLAAAPERLADEDVAPIAASPEPAPRPVEQTQPTEAPTQAPPAPEVVETAPEPAATTPALQAETTSAPTVAEVSAALNAAPAPVEVEATGATPAETTTETTGALAESEAALVEELVDEVASLAPVRAPSAQPRPARRVALASAPEAAEPRAEAAASTIQIQLGAFVSEDVAAEQWAAIKGRNGDLLAGRGRVVTTVQSGGRTLYRLRAGPFATIGEASTLCRGLKARDEACIVARAR